MEWLNYHHLLYFWVVAREGSIAKACRRLHLTQPTISAQIRRLEKTMKAQLFARSGRGLVLTDTGQMVYRYADEIFSLGRELQDAIRDRPRGRALRFAVGVSDALPKVVVHKLLAPAFHADDDVRVTCLDGEPERLLAQLAIHELDLVVSDVPASPRLGMKAFTHVLGDCGVTFFATRDMARSLRRGFPGSLTGAPLLLPVGTSALRRSLDQWFEERDIRPRVVGEFSDSALLKSFGAAGEGVFAAPTAVEDEVRRMYGVGILGRDESIRERFYAISVEKRLQHPAVLAISTAAKTKLFRH